MALFSLYCTRIWPFSLKFLKIAPIGAILIVICLDSIKTRVNLTFILEQTAILEKIFPKIASFGAILGATGRKHMISGL